MTQSQAIINAIRASESLGLSYGALLALRISTCPWKRAKEEIKHLKKGEQLDRYTGIDGLVRIRIVKTEVV